MTAQGLEDVVYELKQANERLEELTNHLVLFRRETDEALQMICWVLIGLLGVIAWRVW